MILAKADLTIARLYADLVEDSRVADEIFRRIETEYQATVDFVLKITGQARLLDKVPVLQGSIERRNPYVDPLSFIQLVLLRRLRRRGAARRAIDRRPGKRQRHRLGIEKHRLTLNANRPARRSFVPEQFVGEN